LTAIDIVSLQCRTYSSVMVLHSPISFPNQADRIYEEASEFRRLSPDDRLSRMLDLIASGETLMARSPKREIASKLREQSEADWQRAFKQLFADHGLTAEQPATDPADGAERTDASA
jgi:hypothetical protein